MIKRAIQIIPGDNVWECVEGRLSYYTVLNVVVKSDPSFPGYIIAWVLNMRGLRKYVILDERLIVHVFKP